MKRFRMQLYMPFFLAIFFTISIPVTLIVASEGEQLFWVKYNQDAQEKSLSNGQPAPSGAIPGQFYELEDGRMKRENQWRSPLDLIFSYKAGKERRVEFSHERHFALIGEKNCSQCHDDSTGLGNENEVRSSSVKPGEREAHAKQSMGRFCSSCHNGSTLMDTISDRIPESISAKSTIFTANHTGSSQSCHRCHVPADHRSDYTNHHGEDVEHKRNNTDCSNCHRGADRKMNTKQKRMARAFRRAQLQLIQNPENKASFQKILPPVFCAYCHISDNEAWERD